MTETKKTTRRQLSDDARVASMEGRWEDALTLNKILIERTPKDAPAFNRMGKAYLELGDVQQASEAYTASLRIDPANMIARRNLQRLEQLRQHAIEIKHREKRLTGRTNVFIQEVGKTWVDELVNPAPTDILAEVASGEVLQLKVVKGKLQVLRGDNVFLGEIDPRTAVRVVELMAKGNTYEVYALGTSAAGLRIILRETFRHPSVADRVSFPRQISQASRYLRERDQLRLRDEADFYFSDDDDDEIDSDGEGTSLDNPDDEPADTDTPDFATARANDDDEENTLI